jgi:hypothetical protein
MKNNGRYSIGWMLIVYKVFISIAALVLSTIEVMGMADWSDGELMLKRVSMFLIASLSVFSILVFLFKSKLLSRFMFLPEVLLLLSIVKIFWQTIKCE